MKFLAKIEFLANLPRLTAIAVVVIAACLLWFAIFFPLLGGLQSSTHDRNDSLKRDIAAARRDLSQSSEDKQYIVANKGLYEEIIGGDRLIPHTRRAAIRQLQDLALSRGLSSLSYNFAAAGDASLKTVSSQPKSNLYRVSVENVELKIGAPLDTQIFDFALDLAEAFPGAAVVQFLQVDRPATVTDAMLDKLNESSNPGIVSGSIKFTWRTAQANEDKQNK